MKFNGTGVMQIFVTFPSTNNCSDRQALCAEMKEGRMTWVCATLIMISHCSMCHLCLNNERSKNERCKGWEWKWRNTWSSDGSKTSVKATNGKKPALWKAWLELGKSHNKGKTEPQQRKPESSVFHVFPCLKLSYDWYDFKTLHTFRQHFATLLQSWSVLFQTTTAILTTHTNFLLSTKNPVPCQSCTAESLMICLVYVVRKKSLKGRWPNTSKT